MNKKSGAALVLVIFLFFVQYWRNTEQQSIQILPQKAVQRISKPDFSFQEHLAEQEKSTEEILQSLMQYDFSIRVNPINQDEYTKETEEIYKQEFYEVITDQGPLYYPGEVTDSGNVYDNAFYFRERFGLYGYTDQQFMKEVMEEAQYY